MAAFSAHLAAAHELWNLIDKVEQLVVTLKDTLSAEGGQSGKAGLPAVRENLAGAKAQQEDLASRMPSKSHKRGGEGSESGESA